ncbi:hypothetical protein [Paraburkholderia ferrariae]|jgi:hypothetical protein|uniref:hypothetical protein n=1 Tax=Paraburkholderia ferrariae TaxID=386056 RepID=UPI000487C117|nr:hypothetical protein [Paraburkholderia ferrariae]
MHENENNVENGIFDARGTVELKHEATSMYRVLIDFAKMSPINKNRFLSMLNEYLMHSPQIQNQLIFEWGRLIVEVKPE